MNIVFFGSTHDSVLVLEKLPLKDVVAVVTQPPRPVGRKQVTTPTPVAVWAKKHNVPVFTSPPRVHADLLVAASYGEKIPIEFIRSARYGGLNVHPSLLPRWRGADPVPWAILSGDREIGVTVVTLSEKFDRGDIIAQKKVPIDNNDTASLLRAKLFRLGADLLVSALKKKMFTGIRQKETKEPYARRLTREDGHEPWEKIMDPLEAGRINRKLRAFHPWPGLWSLYNGKRVKILGFNRTPTIVQLEGKKPVSWEQFKTAYLAS